MVGFEILNNLLILCFPNYLLSVHTSYKIEYFNMYITCAYNILCVYVCVCVCKQECEWYEGFHIGE